YVSGQQYSVNALTDSSGAIVERYAYDAYGGLSVFDGSGGGRSATAEGNRYSYTGREWDDELAIYHYRARMYDSMCGRFLGRDPIHYKDGLSIYRAYFVEAGVDPSGLEVSVIGISPEGHHIISLGNGQCGYRDDEQQATVIVPCPEMPEDDPEGPSYVEGLNSILRGLSNLKTACANCCEGVCSEQECENQAVLLTNALMTAWQNNYNRPPPVPRALSGGWPHTHEECVGGQYCYTWARAYENAFNSLHLPCFGGLIDHQIPQNQIGNPQGPPGPDGKPTTNVHFYFTVYIKGSKGNSACSASYDDGFFSPKDGCSHSGICPKKPGWGPDEKNQAGNHHRHPFVRMPPFVPSINKDVR
ncbi:MAG: RHS repeat-associated core domain-containing protein, partial [Planctomycetales bacterium]|nr:RHS repeat-associated core domain-containing protein [Planctomycetales bacterium]